MTKANILRDLFAQPEGLPSEVENWLQKELGETVLAFAYCDLTAGLRFGEEFMIVTDAHLLRARKSGGDGKTTFAYETVPLREIGEFEILHGITLNRINVLAHEDHRLLLTFYCTRRQLRTVGTCSFVARQKAAALRGESHTRELTEKLDAQRAYFEAFREELRKARASHLTQNRSALLRLLRYARPFRMQYVIGFVTATLLTAMELLPPYITRFWIDDVLAPAGSGKLANPMAWIYGIILALLAIWGATQLFNFLNMRILSTLGERLTENLRNDVYIHLHRLGLNFYHHRSTGSIISRLTSDASRIYDFLSFDLVEFFIAVITIFGVVIALFVLDPVLAALAVLPVPLMIYMFSRYSLQIHEMMLRLWRYYSRIPSILSDVIPGMRVVKAFGQSGHEARRFRRANRTLRSEAIDFHRYWTAFWPKTNLLVSLSRLMVWGYGAPRVLQYTLTDGQKGMPLGVFVAFTAYMMMFWNPVRRIGMMVRSYNRATSSAERVFEILDTAPAIVTKPKAPRLVPLQGHIVFDRVTFSYDGVRNVLKEVSFEIFPGEMIGLVGHSGSGKSTIINLICRFYDVTEGAIYIDGHDIRDIDLHSYQRQIGMVLQNPYLFKGTVAENIAYGHRDVTPMEIIEAARAAEAHDFITSFPDGYDSVVGERGTLISGGERQRISIARAILHRPRLLILDEATSSLDTETEKSIQEALRHLISGRTTVAIAHRLSTLSNASRLLVLKDGELVEQGTHEELLRKEDGVYARLHRIQMELQSLIAV